MYPAASSGATQAIIDARALAYWLTAEPDRGQALAAYDQDRRPAATDVQLLSNRQMGPESVFNRAHARAPGGFTEIEQLIPRGELETDARSQARDRGLDLEAVNAPSPYDPRPAALGSGRHREHA
jgi:5-methylphenazine-1-carboxylate 1-monooxygenase